MSEAKDINSVLQRLSRRPIPSRRFLLKTQPIIEALDDFANLIIFRDTGGFLVAPQRWGKTVATHYLCEAVQKIIGRIPIIYLPQRDTFKPGVNSFFKYLLTQARFRFKRNQARTESDLRNLFTECIVTRGRRCKHKMVILVIDEAHRLTIEQWGFLFNISNEVDAQGVSLIVLSVGQLSLLETEVRLQDAGREEISERFLQRRIRFRGLVSKSELEFVLKGLDSVEILPGSGSLYLSLFCPQAIARGWRISSHADALWQEYELVYKELKLVDIELPMTYVINTINKLLDLLSKIDSDVCELPNDIFRMAVRRSGIEASIKSATRRKKKADAEKEASL